MLENSPQELSPIVNIKEEKNKEEKTKIQLHPSWKVRLSDEFAKPYMQNLKLFLSNEIKQGKIIYPKGAEYFAALNHTPFEAVKVVILGQDPYHGEGQAHGLCFSVRQGVRPPPSLLNIFKELKTDLGITNSGNGNLSTWADQGLLLLNSVLTVEAGIAAAHQNKGWELFTDQVIKHLAMRAEPIVFMLWGSYAQKKAAIVDPKKHLILRAPHPSPLSAHRGFLGCRHFSQANTFLLEQGKNPIDWRLPVL